MIDGIIHHGLSSYLARVVRMLGPLATPYNSPELRALHAGDPTPDGVAGTSIYSTDADGIVYPAAHRSSRVLATWR